MSESPACPFCGERQAYDEARPSKPIVSAPYKTWERGRFVTKRDTQWNTHCRGCGEQIVWGESFYPVAGVKSWSKPFRPDGSKR